MGVAGATGAAAGCTTPANATPTINPAAAEGAVVKPSTDTRHYKTITLDNGARFVVVQDPDAVFAAVAVNVQAGYMDDLPEVPGLAHFLEHAVHLGSAPFPAETEYKSYLAKHGGASNASTSMAHTVYHLTVHHNGLEGALARLAPFFISPALNPDAAMREVENVHAEFSRNCNSDARKVLQLRRSLSGGPYSQFSTGNITTLRDGPAAQGLHVAQLLRSFWDTHYTADKLTGCVVAPQPVEEVAAWVSSAFAAVRPRTPTAPPAPNHAASTALTSACADRIAAAGASAPGVGRYACDAATLGRGLRTLVRVTPQRSALRTLEVTWLIPQSPLQGNWRWAKPHRLVSHLLGHEGPGSLAAALKCAGLITDLSAGTGDELRLEPGFSFWGVTLQLTEEGLVRAGQVVVAVHHALAMIAALPDAARRELHQEAAQVAQLRWGYADREEPRQLAKDLSTRAHYWAPEHLLAGPALLQEYDGTAMDVFLSHLVPTNMQVVVMAQGAAGPAPSIEKWYGAKYCVQDLPQDLVATCEAALAAPPAADTPLVLPSQPLPPPPRPATSAHAGDATSAPPGQGLGTSNVGALELQPLHPPGPNWALPVDVRLHAPLWPATQDASLTQDAGEEWQQQPAATASSSASGTDSDATKGGTTGGAGRKAAGAGAQPAVIDPVPVVVVEEPGIRLWHAPDTTWAIPKAHVYLSLLTPDVYRDPTAWVTARLLVRLLDDLLQPDVYAAQLLGTSYSLGASEAGFSLHLVGFNSVVPQLLARVLSGLQRLANDTAHVEARHPIIASKLAQQLHTWRHNNPLQHAEYAVDVALQTPHWHVNDSLAALLVNPADEGAHNGNGAATGTPSGGNGGASTRYRLEVGPSAVCALAQRLGTRLHVEGLLHGNVSPDEARHVAGLLRDLLQPAGLQQPLDWPSVAVRRLQAPAGQATAVECPRVEGVDLRAQGGGGGVEVHCHVDNPNPSNTNSAVLYLCQVCDELEEGGEAVKQSVLLDLLVQMASKRAFHELRTTQRLGYVVSLSAHRMHGVLGLQVRVQTPDKAPAVVKSRVRKWLLDYRHELAGTSPEHLSEFKSSLSSKLSEPPKSLADAAGRAWRPIAQRTFAFNRRAAKLAALRDLSLVDLLAFYDTHVLPSTPCIDTPGPTSGPAAAADVSPAARGTSRVLVCEVWSGKAAAEHASSAAAAPPPGGVLTVSTRDAAHKLDACMALYAARPLQRAVPESRL